jgi:hypothetical protein
MAIVKASCLKDFILEYSRPAGDRRPASDEASGVIFRSRRSQRRILEEVVISIHNTGH